MLQTAGLFLYSPAPLLPCAVNLQHFIGLSHDGIGNHLIGWAGPVVFVASGEFQLGGQRGIHIDDLDPFLLHHLFGKAVDAQHDGILFAQRVDRFAGLAAASCVRCRGDPEQSGLGRPGFEAAYNGARGVDDLLVGGLLRSPGQRVQPVVKKDEFEIVVDSIEEKKVNAG